MEKPFTMSISNENWPKTATTIRERCKFMFNNDLMSDLKFVVRMADNKSQSKKVIPVHKFVLSISSPVFYAMFYGELAESRHCVELPDCEYESLLEFLRFIYSDEVNLGGNNVMQVMYLAKKYMVSSLADKCTQYLQDNVDPSNVFSILSFAERYEEQSLVNRCWKVIDGSAEMAVESDGFVTIERSLLEVVVERARENMNIKDVNLFAAVNQWATGACERQGLEANGEVKRRILGERVINKLLFPDLGMKDVECIASVLNSEILTPEEIFDAIKCSHSLLISSEQFPEIRGCDLHSEIQRCRRFNSISESCWDYTTGQKDRIVFMVDKSIELHGLCLCGRENYQRYYIVLQLSQVGNGSKLVSMTGKFSSQPLQSRKFKTVYHRIQLLFNQPLTIKGNVRYCVEALISGPSSMGGANGYPFVQCSGVTFMFMNSDSRNSNGTTICRGQFPELLFTLTKRK